MQENVNKSRLARGIDLDILLAITLSHHSVTTIFNTVTIDVSRAYVCTWPESETTVGTSYDEDDIRRINA